MYAVKFSLGKLAGLQRNWSDSGANESHNGSQSFGGSMAGVSSRSSTSSSSRFPKMCGSSFAMEYENGNSSARQLESAAAAWWISGSTGFTSGSEWCAGYDGAVVGWAM